MGHLSTDEVIILFHQATTQPVRTSLFTVVTGTPAKRLFGRLFVIQSVAEVSKLAKAAKGLGLYEYHFHQS
ncbi:hypothetical protein WJX75_001925 [Coccomyxa subellipsoidea]|uniref:Uncharacterized protein n=1 Tax=Coccomyxa subellipsoidea TaxID=248742 RepID=A0ABR2YP19_9CHLO